VARVVGTERYHFKPKLQSTYYTFWRDFPADGLEVAIRGDRGMAAIPTNDDLTIVLVGWAQSDAAAIKIDVEGNYLKTLELAPEFGARVRRATREERFTGGAVANFFRKPYGPGWALVGDAGTIAPGEFFDPQKLTRLMSLAAAG
jgi:hypothetical protein